MIKPWFIGVFTGVACVLTGGAYAWFRYKQHKSANTVYVSPNGKVISKDVYDVLDNILTEQEQQTQLLKKSR